MPDFNFFRWVFIAIALFFISPGTIHAIRFARSGLTFTINKTTGLIYRNDQPVGICTAVEKVLLRTIQRAEFEDTYRLSLVMKNHKKLFLAQTYNFDTIYLAAKEIAELLDVEIYWMWRP